MLAFAGIYVIWGTTFLGIALAIRTIPPFLSGGLRFLIAGGAMYLWLRWRAPRPFAELAIGGTVLCGVLLTGIGNGFMVWSQRGLPSGIAALFVGALPVSTLIFNWLFFARRAPGGQALLGVAIALLGVVLLALRSHTLSSSVRPVHIVAVLIAEMAWSLGTLLQPRYAGPRHVVQFSCLQMLAGAAFQLLMSGVDREWGGFSLAQISTQSLLAVLYLVVFGSLIAVNCYSFLVAHVAAQKVTTYALVNPVIALALGAAVLGEPVSPVAQLSAVLVLIGVALVLFQAAPAVAPAPLERDPSSP